MSNVTEKGLIVLKAAVKHNTREKIARRLDQSIAQVNGALTGLKRNGLIEIDADGVITVTPDAAPYLSKRAGGTAERAPRTGTKMEAARAIFNKFAQKEGRSGVIDRLVAQVGLTAKGASTYFQTLRVQAGIPAGAFQRAPRKQSTVSRKTS